MTGPDPDRTRQWLLAWTTDDLLFPGRAYWRVTDGTRPRFLRRSPRWRPATCPWITDGHVAYLGHEVTAADVVEFLSPLDGLLYADPRADPDRRQSRGRRRKILALRDSGRLARADRELRTVGRATSWRRWPPTFPTARLLADHRRVNPYVRYRESTMDPSRLQLVEARLHQRGELANAANIPAYFVECAGRYRDDVHEHGASETGSDRLRGDAIHQTIEQTLSVVRT